jgi:predicted transcriptional regulator
VAKLTKTAKIMPAMRLALPQDLAERLRLAAFDLRKTKSAIIRDALRRELGRLERHQTKAR